MAESLTFLLSPTFLVVTSGCGYFAARPLEGEVVQVPSSFNLESDKTPCYLELKGHANGLRMNCFDLDGVLHIHSSRWAKLPRLSGESWTVTVLKQPLVRVEIERKIYVLSAVLIDDEQKRQQILRNRGYWHPWGSISVYRFVPPNG